MNDIGIKSCPDGSGCVAWYYKNQDDKLFFGGVPVNPNETITTKTRITKLIKTRDYVEFSSDQITHETLHKVVNIINGKSSIIDKLQTDRVVP